MTGKIYSSLFISIFFHSLFIIFLIFGIKNSARDFKNLTYVTLIQEANNTGISSQANPKTNEENKTIQEKPAITKKDETTEKTTKITKDEEKLLQERLSALRAKKRILESASSSKTQGGTPQVGTSGSIKGEEVSSSYLGLISGLIRQKWSIPETVPKNLEAIVSVRILPNGQVVIEGFEKHSGNALFDSSVIKALKNSSPLPPPKGEVVVGLRFKP
jgi:colicin import membrane protein